MWNTMRLVACVGVLVGSTRAHAVEPDHSRRDRCVHLDLRAGTSTPLSPFVQFVVPPADTNGDGYAETVLRMRVNDPALHRFPEAVRFAVTYDADPTGMSVNIGDSQSNDGFSGDAVNQSNDAELQIGNLASENPAAFDDLLVFGRDGVTDARGSSQLVQVFNIAGDGETVYLGVSNNELEYTNASYSIAGDIKSTWLFALRGQRDTEGPVNYDIYAAFNRTIADASRSGTGVARVTICPARDDDRRQW